MTKLLVLLNYKHLDTLDKLEEILEIDDVLFFVETLKTT